MGGMLHFRELRGVTESGNLRDGVRIEEYDALRDHVDNALSPTLEMDTTEGNEYPRYEYLHGVYYGHDGEPLGSDPYFIDNVYPDDYERVFAGISEYTAPFVVLAARSFPRMDELLHGIERTPYIVSAVDGEAEMHEVELDEFPAYEELASEVAETL